MSPNPLAEPFAPTLVSAAMMGNGLQTGDGNNSPLNTSTRASEIPEAGPPSNHLEPPIRDTKDMRTRQTNTRDLPSLPILSDFLAAHFPAISSNPASEVPWLYHSPLPLKPTSTPRSLPSNSRISKLVLSITPTEGFYSALNAYPPLPKPAPGPASMNPISESAPAIASIPQARNPKHNPRATASFLHRPWTLARGRLPRGTTVWASHKAFDEGLTVGCNFALLGRLGLDVESARVLQGYKGDVGRRIGAVVSTGKDGLSLDEMRTRVEGQFGKGVGQWSGFDEGGNGDTVVKALACMNAFHPEEVERVAEMAVEAGLIATADDCSQLAYLTGAVRDEGLEAARKKGMKVICVGHRECEIWGVGYLVERVRDVWPRLEVVAIDEEEVVLPKEKKLPKSDCASSKKTRGIPKKSKEIGSVAKEPADVSKKRKIDGHGVDEEDGGVPI